MVVCKLVVKKDDVDDIIYELNNLDLGIYNAGSHARQLDRFEMSEVKNNVPEEILNRKED